MGGASSSVFGGLVYDATLTDTVSASQTPLTSFDGALTWTTGAQPLSDGSAVAFNQLAGASPVPVDQMLMATVTIIVNGVGTVNIGWDYDTLDFFGVTPENAPGITFSEIPEPTTATLLALGPASPPRRGAARAPSAPARRDRGLVRARAHVRALRAAGGEPDDLLAPAVSGMSSQSSPIAGGELRIQVVVEQPADLVVPGKAPARLDPASGEKVDDGVVSDAASGA